MDIIKETLNEVKDLLDELGYDWVYTVTIHNGFFIIQGTTTHDTLILLEKMGYINCTGCSDEFYEYKKDNYIVILN